MEKFRFSGKRIGSWELPSTWVGFDSRVTYTVYENSNSFVVVRHGEYVRKNEHFFAFYQLDCFIETIDLEKIKAINFAETAEFEKFSGKRNGSWRLPPACFGGKKEVVYTVYKADDGYYTVVGDWKEAGEEKHLFVIYRFSSFSEATESEVGRMLPLAVFV